MTLANPFACTGPASGVPFISGAYRCRTQPGVSIPFSVTEKLIQKRLPPDRDRLVNRALVVNRRLLKGGYTCGRYRFDGFICIGHGGPAEVRIGAQLGLESTDLVMPVMNQKGMGRLAGDKSQLAPMRLERRSGYRC